MIKPIEFNNFFAGSLQEHLEKIFQQLEELKQIDL